MELINLDLNDDDIFDQSEENVTGKTVGYFDIMTTELGKSNKKAACSESYYDYFEYEKVFTDILLQIHKDEHNNEE